MKTSKKFIKAQKKKLATRIGEREDGGNDSEVLENELKSAKNHPLVSEPSRFMLKFEITNEFIEELINFAIAEGEYEGDIEIFWGCLYEHIFDQLYGRVDLPDGYYMYSPVSVCVEDLKNVKYAFIRYEKNPG